MNSDRTPHLCAPLEAFLAITGRCNLRCRHCNVFPQRTGNSDLDTEVWVRLIRDLAQMKVFSLWFSGGEPFLREDLFTLLEEVESHHFRYGLNTNATMVDGETARRLGELKRLDEVVVSLDGSCAEIHERTRGKGSFEPAVEGIGNLVRHNRVSTYTTVSRLNYGDLEGIVRLGLDLGAVSMKFNEVLPLGQGAIHRDDLVLTNEERREVAQRLHDLNAGSGGRIVGSFLVMLDFYAPFEDLDQGTLSLSPEYRDPNCLTSCAGGVSKCAVRPDGAVIPCDRLWDLTAGNILTEELSGIWHSSPVFEAMRRRQRFSLGDLETCRPCGYNPLCSGGCPAVAYSLTGSVFGRDPMSCYGIYKGGGTPYSPVPPGAKPGLPGEALGSAPGTEPPGRP